MTYTKGPWTWELHADSQKLSSVFVTDTGLKVETIVLQIDAGLICGRDNRTLIAVAPELYELLSKINTAFYSRSTKKTMDRINGTIKTVTTKSKGRKITCLNS